MLNGLQYYLQNDITVFPYNFKNEYNNLTLNIENDNGLNYYLLNGHKLFFKKDWSILSCKSYLKTLLIEQDYRSPHSYCNDDFKVNLDETLLDIGAAEGNFSLLSVDTANEIYLFEYNTEWFSVLQKTFEPFKNKVKLFNKKVEHVSSNTSSLALDDLEELYTKKLFIKMDVEGSERAIFKGMEKLLSANKKIRLAICTYHGYNDAIEFEKIRSLAGAESGLLVRSSGDLNLIHDTFVGPSHNITSGIAFNNPTVYNNNNPPIWKVGETYIPIKYFELRVLSLSLVLTTSTPTICSTDGKELKFIAVGNCEFKVSGWLYCKPYIFITW